MERSAGGIGGPKIAYEKSLPRRRGGRGGGKERQAMEPTMRCQVGRKKSEPPKLLWVDDKVDATRSRSRRCAIRLCRNLPENKKDVLRERAWIVAS